MAIGTTQLVIIALLVVALFGARRLATLGAELGQGMRNFKKGLRDIEDVARVDSGDEA